MRKNYLFPTTFRKIGWCLFVPFAITSFICLFDGSNEDWLKVSDNISGQETFERECAPLFQIRDAYPKMIIARTKHPKYSYEGIEIHDIADWLLQE